jgi:hypothetical protein
VYVGRDGAGERAGTVVTTNLNKTPVIARSVSVHGVHVCAGGLEGFRGKMPQAHL